MFRYLTGKLVASSQESVTIDILGIGFQVLIAPNSYEQFPALEATITLHVAFVIREFSQTLYGFFREQDRDLFERLLSISGIGPKLALNIIGHLMPHELSQALFQKDVKTLCKVPGIGKKTAERLLLELKEIAIPLDIPKEPLTSPIIQDAVSALVNLGYNQMQAQRAVSKTLDSFEEEVSDLSLLITASLRNL